MTPLQDLLWVAGGSMLLSGLLVWASLHYARRRGLLDAPGRRRSHRVPTPRGGGLGLVLASVPALWWGWQVAVPVDAAPWAGPGLLAALAALLLTGWVDDHRNLPNLPRLAVHLAASLLLALVVWQALSVWPLAWRVPAAAGLLLATAWSINLHNFMDGIDALLASQMAFHFASLTAFAWFWQQPGFALACIGISGASLGFLFWNRPPARIFMGDVGSVVLGWLVAAVAALLWLRAPAALYVTLLLASAFILDASLTLLQRISNGRRWYTAHREHAYQWLVRSGFTHGQVVLVYLAWNLLVALPAAILAAAMPRLGPVLLVMIALLGWAAHAGAKRRCLAIRNRRRHGAA